MGFRVGIVERAGSFCFDVDHRAMLLASTVPRRHANWNSAGDLQSAATRGATDGAAVNLHRQHLTPAELQNNGAIHQPSALLDHMRKRVNCFFGALTRAK